MQTFIILVWRAGYRTVQQLGSVCRRGKKLDSYWERFEHFVKPHSNELIAAWELHNLRQGTLSLEEFISKLRILVKEASYPVEHNDRFLRDFLVLGMNSDRLYVRTASRLEMPSRLTQLVRWPSQKSQQRNNFSQ